MADKLEWVGELDDSPEAWHLLDSREGQAGDARVVLYPLDEAETIFYPVYRSAIRIHLPKPEGMSIDQLKGWALNQFLLLRES